MGPWVLMGHLHRCVQQPGRHRAHGDHQGAAELPFVNAAHSRLQDTATRGQQRKDTVRYLQNPQRWFCLALPDCSSQVLVEFRTEQNCCCPE